MKNLAGDQMLAGGVGHGTERYHITMKNLAGNTMLAGDAMLVIGRSGQYMILYAWDIVIKEFILKVRH